VVVLELRRVAQWVRKCINGVSVSYKRAPREVKGRWSNAAAVKESEGRDDGDYRIVDCECSEVVWKRSRSQGSRY
jgi:hypothetical protein